MRLFRHSIYPFRTGDRYKSLHYFVEFENQGSVKRARALQLRDTRVHVLSYSPDLVEQFLSVAPGANDSRDRQALDAGEQALRPWSGPGTRSYQPRSWAGTSNIFNDRWTLG